MMFVTYKFQHYTLLKIPNFDQNSAKIPIQARRAKRVRKSPEL